MLLATCDSSLFISGVSKLETDSFVLSLLLFFILRVFFKKYFIYLFLESGREGERQGENHQCVVSSHMPPCWRPGLKPRHVP